MEKDTIDAILGPADGASPDGDDANELELVAQELIEAVHARNPKDVAQALRAAFTCLDSEPHEEGESES